MTEINALEGILQFFPDLYFRLTKDGTCLEGKQGQCNHSFHPIDEWLGKQVTTVLPEPVGQAMQQAIQQVFQTQGCVTIDYSLSINGTQEYYEARLCPFQEAEVLVIVRDISDRKRREISLQENESLFRVISEQMSDALLLLELDDQEVMGQIIYANATACHRYGYKYSELIGQPITRLDSPEDAQGAPDRFERLLAGETLRFEANQQRADGTTCTIEALAKPISYQGRNVVLSLERDVTERKQAEAEIQQTLAEKELLLREIHHRVKNNLMVVSSLLSLQSHGFTDPKILKVFQDNQNRIFSMSMIHEKLYQSHDLSQINLGDYLQDLCLELFSTFGDRAHHIQLHLDTAPISVNLETAMPCGLILNELISNSLKYAFPDQRSGQIHVQLQAIADNLIRLSIGDDGISIPIDLLQQTNTSLGLRLVKTLAHQLKAEMSCDCSHGTLFQFTFAELEYQRRF